MSGRAWWHRLLGLAAFAGLVGAADAGSADYAQAHDRVDIGGRRLNLFCIGSGSPTVVFDSGSGQAGWDWLHVHPKVAERTRACIYDRAAFGFSDPAPASRPGTTEHALEDLQALLKTAGIGPPYVLVAHSYAAMPAQLFAYRQPGQVAGLVLVDGHHEDEFARIDRITQGQLKRMTVQLESIYRGCANAASKGLAPGSPQAQECIGQPPAGAGRELTAAYIAQQTRPSYWQASAGEYAQLYGASSDSLRAARRSFGDLPMVCLTRGVSPYLTPGQPQSALNKAVERDNEAMQREVCALSSRGRAPIIAGAGHAIHIDRPEVVIDAVFEVLQAARR